MVAGLAVSAASAAVSSFGALRGLAIAAGWPVRLAPLLPIVIDSYAATATRVWLSSGTGSRRAKRFARVNALIAIGLSLIGNATYHLIAAGLLRPSWMVVVAVGSTPALALGAVSHLAVLRHEVDPRTAGRDRLGTGNQQSPDSGRLEDEAPDRRPYRSDTELLQAAQKADRVHRQSHGGRPIPRDQLRQVLRIGGSKASELLRQLKADAATSPEVNPPP